jgi:hypothetical protein
MTRRRSRLGATSSGISQREVSHPCQRISEGLQAVALTGRNSQEEEASAVEQQEEAVEMLVDPDLASSAVRPLT